MARIIKTLMDEGPLPRTKLSTFSELSYDKFQLYLEWLTGNGIVSESDGTVNVTSNGVETYNRLVNWIIKYVGKLKFARKR